jgi:phosphoglycolate phosphatase
MKVVLFDIDGTLILTGGAGNKAFAKTFADVFGVPQISSNVSFAGRSDKAISHELFRAHGIAETPENWATFQREYLVRLGPTLASLAGEVLPGVVELVEKLQALDGVDIGLLTGNIRAGAEQKLTHYGLWRYFEFGGFGDRQTERAEIAREAVAAARERWSAKSQANGGPDRIVVIGDTEHDIRCARAVGAYAVAAPTGHTPSEVLAKENPDLLVNTLEDHAAILTYLAA